MLKKLLLIFLIFSFASYAESTDSEENNSDFSEDQFYSDLLQKHEKQGHLNSAELKNYEFRYAKDKSWQEKFNNQVRGVASTLKAPRKKIYLNNPAIEISVK